MSRVIGAAAALLALYGLMAFAVWEINPGSWPAFVRSLFSVLAPTVVMMALWADWEVGR
jgi:hypothetical protein